MRYSADVAPMRDDDGISTDATDLPWPEVGDHLFRDPGWLFGAHIGNYEGERHFRLTAGYKQAGDILVREADRPGNLHQMGNLLYPIVFCYRQYLELAMKGLIERHGEPIGLIPVRKTHRLKADIWPVFRKLIESVGGLDSQADDTQAVFRCIEEFEKFDPDSFSFRYATDTKGVPVTIPIEKVDLVHLKITMAKLEMYFEGIDEYLTQCRRDSCP